MIDNPAQHAPKGSDAIFHPSFYTGAASRDAARADLYKHFTRPGDLVFDIGANCGEVVNVLLGLGCRVVAVEPQPEVARLIDARAEVVVAAVGATEGTAAFYAVPSNPYLSTLRPDIRDTVAATNASWAAETREVKVTTLDALIGRFGVPVFCKVDVEGFEVEVLRGLSTPLRAMSLEVHSFDRSKVAGVEAELARLGDYGLLYSRGESYSLEPWPLPASVELAWFGDLYASLRDPA
jgi:FkbM family methyltransferase